MTLIWIGKYQSDISYTSDWNKYHFNAVFHGDKEAKFREHEIQNRSKLTPLGVEFIYFDRDYRLSTSNYLKKIRNDER